VSVTIGERRGAGISAGGQPAHQTQIEGQIVRPHAPFVDGQDEPPALRLQQEVGVLDSLGDALEDKWGAQIEVGQEAREILFGNVCVDGHDQRRSSLWADGASRACVAGASPSLYQVVGSWLATPRARLAPGPLLDLAHVAYQSAALRRLHSTLAGRRLWRSSAAGRGAAMAAVAVAVATTRTTPRRRNASRTSAC
jgi:hypothetical protein